MLLRHTYQYMTGLTTGMCMMFLISCLNNLDRQHLDLRNDLGQGQGEYRFTKSQILGDTDQSARQVKIVVMVLTSPDRLKDKAAAVRDTWGQRADRVVYVR